jgi:hypothetical protein
LAHLKARLDATTLDTRDGEGSSLARSEVSISGGSAAFVAGRQYVSIVRYREAASCEFIGSAKDHLIH